MFAIDGSELNFGIPTSVAIISLDMSRTPENLQSRTIVCYSSRIDIAASKIIISGEL